MPDLIKTLLDLIDIIIKWILRMIPPFVAIISFLVAYYYYKINKINKETFKMNNKNYFYNKGCKKNNNECSYSINNKILKCPDWICKSEHFNNYYCFDGNTCNKTIKKKNKTICGYNQIGYTPNKVYRSKEKCLKNLDYKNYDKQKCLGNSRFLGWYINSNGKGECVKGSPMGPNEITLDYKIDKGLTNKNTFQIGNPSTFIM